LEIQKKIFQRGELPDALTDEAKPNSCDRTPPIEEIRTTGEIFGEDGLVLDSQCRRRKEKEGKLSP